jgi:PAS domain S-box-containing protein
MTNRKPLSTMSVEELRRENKELRHQLNRYHSFIDKVPDPVFIYDGITYKILRCNESFLKNYGYTIEEALTLTPFDLVKPEELAKVRKNIARVSAGTPVTFVHLTKDRRERIVEILTEAFYFAGNPAWMTIAHDITERKMMEEKTKSRLEEMVAQSTLEVMVANEKLKAEIEERKKAETAILESEIKFRNIIEKSLDGIILVDETGSIIEWNEGQEVIYGIKSPMVAGKKIWDVQFQHEPEEKRSEENRQKIKRLWKSFYKAGINPFENKLQVTKIERPDGKLRDVQQSYFTIETDKGSMMACTTRDITSALLMEKQFTQSQKMEAMGTLAGGIAHDFNNVLGGIIGYTELALRKSDQKSSIRKYLDQVLTASSRATDLVKQILTFSRSETKEKEPVRISLIVKEALKLLRSSIPVAIEIVSRIDDDCGFILADSTQIHQVVMNLCTNASHAMKEKGGVIEVRLKQEVIEAGFYEGLKAGPYLRLSISDTGHGIEPELIDKIFDPFFTTKKEGEGTGMGLAVAHGIIKSHNGHISVYSKIGEGTTFSVLLPVVVDVIHIEEKQEEEIPGGDERILLVEDDGALAEAEKKLLEELGYSVTIMSNGLEALEIFKKVPGRFDLVITDYSMPKMTGVQLITQIRAVNTDIPIMICTGFSKVISKAKARSLGVGNIIMKPIELGKIAKSIRRLLDKHEKKNP